MPAGPRFSSAVQPDSVVERSLFSHSSQRLHAFGRERTKGCLDARTKPWNPLITRMCHNQDAISRQPTEEAGEMLPKPGSEVVGKCMPFARVPRWCYVD